MKLRDLPDDTEIYCGHEYTAANIRFARTIEPDNAALAAREAQVEQQIAQGEPTIPVTIGDEKLANPFLRADHAGGRRRHRHGRQSRRRRCSRRSARARTSSSLRSITASERSGSRANRK